MAQSLKIPTWLAGLNMPLLFRCVLLGPLLLAAVRVLSSPTAAELGMLLLLMLLAALASLHRPLGSSGLGLGALVLPLAIVHQDAWAAALLGAVAFFSADLGRRAVARRLVPALREERGWMRSLDGALYASVASLVAGLAWSRSDGSAVPRLLLAAAVYLLLFATLDLAGKRLHRPLSRRQALSGLTPFAADGLAWLLGSLPIVAGLTMSWRAVLVGSMSLLSAESGRLALLVEAHRNRHAHLRRMQGAHRRILGETSGLAAIAQQVLVECRNVMPLGYFELAVRGEHGGGWSAGPEALLEPGPPRLPANPPPLPGIHRRAAWKTLERVLSADDQELARLRLWCDPRRIEPGAEELLDALVPQMASALHRARLDREARFDALTELPVRRVLDGRLQEVYQSSCEEGRTFAVILCDIDFFKKVNDTYGHAAGDAALQVVAKALDGARREQDLCSRYGGEEFAVILEGADGEQALAVAERLRRAVEAATVLWEDTTIPVTLSCGAAAFPELHIKTASELLLLADEALYRAKDEGRNQAFLHLGKGRFQSPSGSVLGDPDGSTPVAPPRIFG